MGKAPRTFTVTLILGPDDSEESERAESIARDILQEISCCSHLWDSIIVKEEETDFCCKWNEEEGEWENV